MKLHADIVEYEGNGASTNGIYASITYSHSTLKAKGVSDLIEIFYHFSPPSTNIPFILPHSTTITNGHIFYIAPFNRSLYFSASNLFCGVAELINADGGRVPALRSNVVSQSSYPVEYSLSQAREELSAGRFDVLEPVAITGNGRRYSWFNLPDVFNIEKPGNYWLTLWPKIYKRSEINRDIVKRIDLPPVTFPIKWTENSTN